MEGHNTSEEQPGQRDPGDFEVFRRTFIQARKATVYRCLVESSLLSQWMGNGSEITPSNDGNYSLTSFEGASLEGTVLDLDPPHTLTLSWGYEGHEVLPSDSSAAHFTLRAQDNGTVVTLQHGPLRDPDLLLQHDSDWRVALARLADCATRLEYQPALPDLLTSWFKCWSESDVSRLKHAISACCDMNVVYLAPAANAVGIAELLMSMRGYAQRKDGREFEAVGEAKLSHATVLVPFRERGSKDRARTFVLDLSLAGKIRRVVVVD